MRIRGERDAEKNQLNMTSMIDVVFLLLIFFVMTFKIVEMEGDFSVRMPLASDAAAVTDPTDLPLKLRMTADANGNLSAMLLNDSPLGNDPAAFDRLRASIVDIVGTTAPIEGDDGPEIEIDADYSLRYENVIRAFTAVSGYKDGNQIVKLIEKVKFAKPRM
ncbi:MULTISPECIES: ExbD/TolR family protein [Crateriforma]|uniref:Biopolymer transport protein ExbD/TolR n=1 Tax=Crateriforma conspicua TaxID=2527996 RepID=A0A5C6FQH2_9PLAN|nr:MULTISPECIES: biopolymer transporter ExbD [Crateriforma]TWU65392.1 Biopolymer transport protein ExbD/TolR [Crateriforma conspicua]